MTSCLLFLASQPPWAAEHFIERCTLLATIHQAWLVAGKLASSRYLVSPFQILQINYGAKIEHIIYKQICEIVYVRYKLQKIVGVDGLKSHFMS